MYLENIIPTIWIEDTEKFSELMDIYRLYGIKKLRVNCTRHTVEEYVQMIDMFVRKYHDTFRLLLDIPIPGSKIRIYYNWTGKEREIVKGQKYRIGLMGDDVSKYDFYITYSSVIKESDIRKGLDIHVGENGLSLKVCQIDDKFFDVKACNSGIIPYGKYIYYNDVKFVYDEKALGMYTGLVKQTGIKDVALSFVEKSTDVEKIRKEIGMAVNIISKIETEEAVKNLQEIIKQSDEVMLARGDLYNNTGVQRFGKVVAEIISQCHKYDKRLYYATGVLESISLNRKMPSRTDVIELYNVMKDKRHSIILDYGHCNTPEKAVNILDVISAVEL